MIGPAAQRLSMRFPTVESYRDLHTGSDFADAYSRLRHPATFLRAERGMLDQPDALYSADQVAAALDRRPTLTAGTVTGVNHYTIVLSERGAAAVADAVSGSSKERP